jgi:hypothetical protein
VIFNLPGYRVMAPSTCRWAVAGSRCNLLILLMAAQTVMVVSLSHCESDEAALSTPRSARHISTTNRGCYPAVRRLPGQDSHLPA